MRACLALLALAVACSNASAGTPDVPRGLNGESTLVQIQFAGGSDGVLVTSSPRGISCANSPSDSANVCRARFPKGAPVLLTAVKNACSFTWSGACTGTYCALEGMTDETLTLTVSDQCAQQRSGSLEVDVRGPGRVGSDTVRIDCGRRCSADVATNGEVVLVADPLEGAKFVGWSGRCSGTGECRFDPGSAAPPWRVTAEFSR